MPAISLSQILGLVGTLDDSPGQATGRERFRSYLRESVSELGVVRDYVESCLRESDVQYARALQDLINHVGRLMDFDVEFGRYSGVTGEIGHDGLWIAGELAIVVEVKKSDTYAIDTSVLSGYIDQLGSTGRLPSGRSSAMGLYVVGQSRQDLQQLRNSIMAEERTHQLRVSSVDSILSLAELIESGRIERDEAVALLRPTQVVVDETVGVLARVAAAEPVSADTDTPTEPSRPSAEALKLLTPVRDEEERSAADTIRELLEGGEYRFGEHTPHRQRLQEGDRICFYQTQVGVVAEAEIASPTRHAPREGGDNYPWMFDVRNPRFFFDAPVVIDAALRPRLDAFDGRDPAAPWSWFVQTTRSLSDHDFAVLTGVDAAGAESSSQQ